MHRLVFEIDFWQYTMLRLVRKCGKKARKCFPEGNSA